MVLHAGQAFEVAVTRASIPPLRNGMGRRSAWSRARCYCPRHATHSWRLGRNPAQGRLICIPRSAALMSQPVQLPDDSAQSDVVLAFSLKEKGNKAYAQKRFDLALKHYSDGIKVCPDDDLKATLYLNRSQLYLLRKDFPMAEKDVRECLAVQADNLKAQVRLAIILDKRSSYKEAYDILSALPASATKTYPVITMMLKDLKPRVSTSGIAIHKAKDVPLVQASSGDPSWWYKGLTPAQVHMKLIMAFVMRVEDSYVWRGELIGTYGQHAGDYGPEETKEQFIDFVESGAAQGLLPPDFDMEKLLADPEISRIEFAYEKSDVVSEFGPLEPMALRLIAEQFLNDSLQGF
ncbi:hypothetical protein J8273_1593 [Carpediemonas membranifera]|uniref:Tetratricopeptide repeat protein n=1 Tax=Carpediemonas membranifera TaxID=201153 RepID=A0A8J6BAC7_9EUKA|nr:hypothetical protein J8273_1593 [Carpediemonas membranifera]|eukprot:KAG9396584.1 hypothetical protein J8273_1593 [Carpediemonas membranifera]